VLQYAYKEASLSYLWRREMVEFCPVHGTQLVEKTEPFFYYLCSFSGHPLSRRDVEIEEKEFVICKNCGKRAYKSDLKGAYWCDSERCQFNIWPNGEITLVRSAQ